MKIIINLEFCKTIWKSDIKKVKEPYRTKKLRECCTKIVHENNKTIVGVPVPQVIQVLVKLLMSVVNLII